MKNLQELCPLNVDRSSETVADNRHFRKTWFSKDRTMSFGVTILQFV